MSYSKKVTSGENFALPEKIATVFALRVGVNRNNIPDEVLQRVNSIKVRINPDGWKKVPINTKSTNSWRSGTASSFRAQPHTSTHPHTNTVVSDTHSSTSHQLPPQNRKYVSKFKNSENNCLDDKILNTLINGKLNTFSPANYNDIKSFLEQILDSGETAFIKEFMLLVFKKAASEETYCPHYARLLAELSKSYSSLTDEMVSLQTKFLEIFEEVSETETDSYKSFLERNSEKIYRLGYSQFLSELAHREVLSTETIINTLQTLLSKIKHYSVQEGKNKLIEEYCDCMFRMAKVFKGARGAYIINLKVKVSEAILPELVTIVAGAADAPSISKKAKFSMIDVMDILRDA